MIHVGSYLKLMDNSGTKEIQCIRVVSPSNKKPARIGDQILVSIQSSIAKERASIKKGKIYRAVLVHTKKLVQREAGDSSSLGKNIAVLINPSKVPLSTRFLGCLPYEIRREGFIKLLSTSKYLY
jgi:large subunit ribosomal protein L14